MHNQEQYYAEQGVLGDTLTTLIEGNEWKVFKAEVLDKMFLSAFDLFQGADPDDKMQIIEIQQLAKVVKSIEDRINNLIQAGRLARENLKSEPPEWETDGY